MIPSWVLYVSIIGLFALLLAIKPLIKRGYCAMCASVSITWLTLLILFWMGILIDVRMLALLIGESIVGLYFLLEKSLPKIWHVFKLPFLLTATFVGALLIQATSHWLRITAILAVLWMASILIFLMRKHASLRTLVKRLLACCKKW